MKKWFKDLTELVGSDQLVRIKRKAKFDDTFDGYIVGVNESFVMLHILCDDTMVLDGYTVLRTADIRRVYFSNENKSFLNRALKLKGLTAIPQPEIALSDYPALLKSVNERFPLFTIEQEIKYPGMCFIGKIAKLTQKKLTLDEIDPNAQWSQTHPFKLKHITRVDFGDGYGEALNLVSTHEAALKAPEEPRA